MKKRRVDRDPYSACALDPDLHPAPPAAKHRGRYPGWTARFAERADAAARELLVLAFPVECVCCGAEDRVLCVPCANRLRKLTCRPFRAEARAPALVDMEGAVLLPVVAAGVYRDELAQSVLSFKRHGQRQLAVALAKPLAAAIVASAAPAQGVLLVPVPTSAAAFRRRGFSPVHLLLAHARRSPGLEGAVVADVLRAAGADRQGGLDLKGPGQKGLGRAARARRVRGSMRVKGGIRRPELNGRTCIVVDDVLTTGATLAEAARALGTAGAEVRGAVVLAATRPPVRGDFAGAIAAPARKPLVKENK